MKQYLMLRFMFAVWATSFLMTAMAGIEVQAQTKAHTAAGPSQIVITTTPSSGAVTVQLTLPADVQPDTLSMKLNGNDLSRRFTTVNCPQGICQQAILTIPDGLRDSKNVFSVVAKHNNGTLVSARSRFVGTTATAAARLATVNPQTVHANALSGFPTPSSFLPPAIAFTTLNPGGYDNAHAWIQVGSQNTYPANPSSQPCSNIYTVIVLDRQTLEEKTVAPESSPQCISNGGQLKTYLATLNSGDLVIVGTNSGQNSDALSSNGQLDTSAIGGTAYNCLDSTDCSSLPSTTVQSVDAPQTYMIIGVGGAASGSAYENYNMKGGVWYQINAYGTGTLVEDSNGNYNFQPANSVEYTIVPNDPNNSNVSTVSVGPLPGDPYASAGIITKTYLPPYNPSTPNGIWLLKLQRTTLFSTAFNVQGTPPAPAPLDACMALTPGNGKTAYFHNCGQFYDTGDPNPKTAIAAYNQLGTDLQEIDTNDLIFLVSIGNQPNSPGLNFTVVPSGFANAFSAIGGTPETFTGLNKLGSTYSYVGCVRCGNSLGGNVVVSTNLQSQQGQNGYIHGLLQPNLNGRYWPTQASLDQPGSDGLPTTDFTIQKVTTTQPVDWPELSTTQILTSTTSSGTTYTADTTDGQNAAYYYISYQLVTQYYILGAQGNYLDDIHYYFTGGNNTFFDYHTFDPANLAFPGSSPTGCYQWTDPVQGRGTLACFTQNDFNAVRAQMHNEIVYLTNVLQFMVNGSTNMKDLVASGNGSAALALINAAATVEASTLQPPPATPVKFNISNILNLVGNAVSLAASVATGGLTADGTELAAKAASGLGPSAGVISAIFGASSAVTGGLFTPGSPVPGNNANFLTTIGNLSQSELQQNFTAGFDASLDTILGDWYKLSTIGPQITNTNANAFQSPTQNSQVVATRQIGLGAQRSFYMALLPIDYSIQHYTYWWGTPDAPNNPDMGAISDSTAGNCNTWYYSAPAPSTINLVSKSYLSYSDEGPTKFAFIYAENSPVAIPSPLDWFVIASSAIPIKPGTSSQQIRLLNSQVAATLFTASQLNIPMDPFLDQNGPMASVWWDSATVGFDQFPAKQTCSLYVAGKYGNSLPPTGTLTGSAPNAVRVTLNVPSIGVLGDNIILKATAVVANAPLTSGTIAFSDGDTEIGRSALDSTGTATLTINTLALGAHTIRASFVASTQYTASTPVAVPLVVYANDVDLSLSPSTGSLSVTSGSTSSPLNLQVTSKWGLAGPVAFSCSGLPAGTTCNFAPAQVTLTDGTSATTSLTITSVKQTAKLSSTTGVFAAMLLPLPLLLLRRRYRSIRLLCAIVIVSVASLGILTGCSSGPSAPVAQPTASTVLVTATSGTISRSIPINVTLQ